MPGSGIRVEEELTRAFMAAEKDDRTSFLKIMIADEAFTVAQTAKTGKGLDFAAASGVLKNGEPCYVVIRTNDPTKWMLMLFVPENSPVRSKMLHASSAGALKEGLGNNKFVPDYHITRIQECSDNDYVHFTKESQDHDIMTYDEIIAKEASLDAHMAIGDVKAAVIAELPVQAADATLEAIQSLAGGGITVAVLLLNGETEVLECGFKGKMSLEEAAAKLPPKEPRFVVSRFAHKHPDTGNAEVKNIFIYFCPEGAKPRGKMFYSTSKSVVIKLAAQQGFETHKSIEVSDAKEICDASVLDELYPKKAEKKEFAKPKAQGKGKAKFRGVAFNAEQ